MVESHALRLAKAAAAVREGICDYVVIKLAEQGYQDISPAILTFLGALDCGVNYGSGIARNLKVSRQLVAKMVREMSEAGYLEQTEGSGKQKKIIFTRKGELLMAEVRNILLSLDSLLQKNTSEAALKKMIRTLEDMGKELSARVP
ncbi:MAG: MarR family transcriptional regulator [Gammaproteobacteria bacterium]